MAKRQPRKLSDQVRDAIAAAGKAGVTRYAICQATGIDKAVLYKFAAGERGISLEALDTLAAFLDLEITVRKPKG